jgi:hypothetical protein
MVKKQGTIGNFPTDFDEDKEAHPAMRAPVAEPQGCVDAHKFKDNAANHPSLQNVSDLAGLGYTRDDSVRARFAVQRKDNALEVPEGRLHSLYVHAQQK